MVPHRLSIQKGVACSALVRFLYQHWRERGKSSNLIEHNLAEKIEVLLSKHIIRRRNAIIRTVCEILYMLFLPRNGRIDNIFQMLARYHVACYHPDGYGTSVLQESYHPVNVYMAGVNDEHRFRCLHYLALCMMCPTFMTLQFWLPFHGEINF